MPGDSRNPPSAAIHAGRAAGAGWALFALLAAVLDPVWGLLAALPNLVIGVGPAQRWDTLRRWRRGLAIILGGIEGPSVYQRYLAAGLMRGGWRGAVVVHRWNRGVPIVRVFCNLMSRRRHEREAAAVCALIRDYRATHPKRPIGLLALSGGCWIAVRALERLRADERVQVAALLAPAISRGHDLTRAAARCAAGLVTVRGPGDLFLLGIGTSLLGTSDRRWGPAGGWLGWRQPATGVIDLAWRPAWIRLGYLGNHTSASSPRFVAAVIAPWFRAAPLED